MKNARKKRDFASRSDGFERSFDFALFGLVGLTSAVLTISCLVFCDALRSVLLRLEPFLNFPLGFFFQTSLGNLISVFGFRCLSILLSTIPPKPRTRVKLILQGGSGCINRQIRPKEFSSHKMQQRLSLFKFHDDLT